MVAKKKSDKGFCPFCGQSFSGDLDNCPFCGQNLKMYKDDLGPMMKSIQTATNIDMKSPKVRITMSVVIFLLAFAGALVIFEYYDSTFNVAENEIPPEGIIMEVQNYGYLDLVDDFANQNIKVLPLYDPELKLRFELNNKLQEKYDKITWHVMTEAYNDTNMKNPFYQKVTKDMTNFDDIFSVTWDNICVGKFWITANCYTPEDRCDVYVGSGTYYGKMSKTYTWTYNETVMSFDYTMSADVVKECLTANTAERVDGQVKSSMTDYIDASPSITDLNSKLRSLFDLKTDNKYTDAGYADFVLSFIQSCFPNVYDSFNYRVPDFWAYPTETLLRGCGDDEDRSILYCSIMKDAGLNVAILSFPEATMAAVEVNLDESYIGTYAKTVKGVYIMYTVADTSSDLRLGKLRPYYDVSEDGTTIFYNGEEIHGRYLAETS